MTTPTKKDVLRTPSGKKRVETPASRRKRARNDDIPTPCRRSKRNAENCVRAADILDRIRLLFPKTASPTDAKIFGHIVAKPCMSARLFGCFSLVDSKEVAKRKLMPLLRSLVRVEIVSLGPNVDKRSVQFSGFDCSSTMPPRDSIIGSHRSRARSIDAMVAALAHVNDLLDEPERASVSASLASLSEFLDCIRQHKDVVLLQSGHTIKGEHIRDECAKSVPFDWPSSRFERAAGVYKADIDVIIACLNESKPLEASNKRLHLEKTLAEQLGRGIRFHLRRLLNPFYGPVMMAEEEDDANDCRQSRICEMLEMAHPDWYATGDDTAVADGSISSVFSQAAEVVSTFFGDDFLTSSFEIPAMPESFCTSPASQRGLGTKSEPHPITDEDLEAILEDMHHAQRFLAAAKGCRFLHDLFRFPGVREEIEGLGGWASIERYAGLFREHRLERLSPYDAHLTVLWDMEMLEQRVGQCWEVMEGVADVCTLALDDLWARFECGTKNKRRRQAYPQIEVLETTFADGLKMHMFPSIRRVGD